MRFLRSEAVAQGVTLFHLIQKMTEHGSAWWEEVLEGAAPVSPSGSGASGNSRNECLKK